MQITLEVLFKVFFIAIVIDFISGVLASKKEGRLKSRKCRDGMFESLGECLVLIIFITINYFIPLLNPYISTFIVGFIFKEGLSIVENLVRLNVWVPQGIKNALEVGTNKVDKIDKLNN